MKLLKACTLILILLLSAANASSQIIHPGDEQLATNIKDSNKKYKIIYIFCDYCQPSVERLPRLIELVNKHSESIELFPICAQDSVEVATYLEQNQATTPFYLINQERKRKKISFYNPIKATCKYIERYFNVSADKMGASDFFILDQDNKSFAQTNWEMKDEEYFRILNQLITDNNGI